jgi:hypothetical protein
MAAHCRASHSTHGHSASRSRTVGLPTVKAARSDSTRPKPAWLCGRGTNALAAVSVCGAPVVAWLPAAARPERRSEVWRWGTSGEGRRHRARWLGLELTRGAA